MDAKIGDWVQISNVVLRPDERAPQVPEDTKKEPLLLWVKGYALHAANLGEIIEITTVTSRKVQGVLTEVNPSYIHTYGDYVPELNRIREQVKACLEEEVSK